MKKTRNTKGTLETLLVIGLILIIPLFFVIRTAAVQNTAPNTPAPSLPTVANAPTLSTAANTEEDSAMKPNNRPPVPSLWRRLGGRVNAGGVRFFRAAGGVDCASR